MAEAKRRSLNRGRVYDGDAFVNLFEARGAKEIIVMDSTGRPLRTTVSQRRAFNYAESLYPLVTLARNVVRDLDPSNDVTFLRIRSERQEIHISIYSDFILVAMQRLKKQKE